MGRRAAGQMPRVVVHEASGNARVRFGGKTHWLGRSPHGVVTPEQLAKATRLWNEHLADGNGSASTTTPPAVPEVVEIVIAPAVPPAISSGKNAVEQASPREVRIAELSPTAMVQTWSGGPVRTNTRPFQRAGAESCRHHAGRGRRGR